MLSAVILCAEGRVPVPVSPEAMVRTLAALVPAVVDGLVRDVTLAVLAGASQAREIADHAGCAIAEGDSGGKALAAGVAAARGELLLVLRCGHAPEAGFIDEIADLFERATPPRGALLRAAPATLLTRLAPMLSPVEGLIIRRRDIPAGAASLAELRRAIAAPAQLRTRLRRVV